MRRRCKTGYLVGGLFRIPDDSSVAGVADSANPVDCSRLHCSDCGRQVRQAGGLAVGRGRSPSDLCDAPDWTRLDCVRTDPDARLYCCACVLHVEFSWRLLGDTEERMSLPRFWGCAGHPEPAGAESSGYG